MKPNNTTPTMYPLYLTDSEIQVLTKVINYYQEHITDSYTHTHQPLETIISKLKDIKNPVYLDWNDLHQNKEKINENRVSEYRDDV